MILLTLACYAHRACPLTFFLYAGVNTLQATSTCISLACLQGCEREAAPQSTSNKCWDDTLHLLTLQRELAMLPQVRIGSFQTLCILQDELPTSADFFTPSYNTSCTTNACFCRSSKSTCSCESIKLLKHD